MALVVFLRGVNVGGHRTFRPSTLIEQLKHLNAVNIGAAGTFVVRQPVRRAQLRLEFARRLPFTAEITICHGREIIRLMSCDLFSGHLVRPDMVRFVSVLSQAPHLALKWAKAREPASANWTSSKAVHLRLIPWPGLTSLTNL